MDADAALNGIKRLLSISEEMFDTVREPCEHRNRELCIIPVSIYPENGIILCRFDQCPLLKED